LLAGFAILIAALLRSLLAARTAQRFEPFALLDPPAQIRELTSGLRDKVDQARAATTTTQAGGGT
jgi:hypothetical protein